MFSALHTIHSPAPTMDLNALLEIVLSLAALFWLLSTVCSFFVEAIVSLRQTCMKSFDVLANLVVEFNPMRSTADGQTSKGRANGW